MEDASLFVVGRVLSQLETEGGGGWSLHMPAIVYGCPSVDITLLGVKCWQLSLCARISDHI